MDRSFKAQLKYVNKIAAEYMIVLGEDELNTRQAKIKNMQTGEEESISLDEIMDYFNRK